MKIRTWLLIKAWVDIITGLGFLILPVQAVGALGVATDEAGLAVARFFGQAMFLMGLMLWMVRNVHEPRSQKAIASAVVVGDGVGAIVALRTTMVGTINAFGWVIMAVYIILAIGFALTIYRIPEPVTTP